MTALNRGYSIHFQLNILCEQASFCRRQTETGRDVVGRLTNQSFGVSNESCWFTGRALRLCVCMYVE